MSLTAYDCAETIRRLNDYLDRELSPEEVEMVEAHLATCEHCAAEYGFEQVLLGEIKAKMAQATMPEELRARLQAFIAKARD
ncbi:MAG TPA: zf-HC2 domain-containing protein [Fimbriimonadaceae bacterium]|nr:zf-HC2 domain-containing protein [Fimbriimonadaceae bacterium]